MPIGKSLIKQEIDISKNISKINYGYNYFIEQEVHARKPILSRKYKIYYKNQPFIVIKEFFPKS